MIAITSLLITLALSLLVTRVATMALMLTGLSRATAQFQARSAFSGVGYTTGEAESVVNHPVRRQIVMVLMLLGNIGVATVVATMIISVIDLQRNEERLIHVSLLAFGVLGLWVISKSRWVERRLNIVITWALRRFTRLDVHDYVALLNLRQGYSVTEMSVAKTDWMANRTLVELNLPKEGILVLGIQRSDGDFFIGAPTATTEVQPGDRLVLYGPSEQIEELDRRRAGRKGDAAHRDAVAKHEAGAYERSQLASSDRAEGGGPD